MSLELILYLAGIIFLLFLSALFSSSETALTAISRARIHHLAQRGNRRAKIVNNLIDSKERFIGSILLGNNLVNILASSLATSILISNYGKAGVAYATVIMTTMVLIFAEVLPKTYAIHKPDRTALALAPILSPAIYVLTPFVFLTRILVQSILKVFGIRLDEVNSLITPAEEIRGALDLHHKEGVMIKADKDMLDGILDLRSIGVSEIMVHRRNMVIIDGSLTSEQIVSELIQSTYTRVPLYLNDEDNIIGIIHAKDVLPELIGSEPYENIDMVALARPPWFVPDTTTLDEQLNAFRTRHEHFALIVDEYGALKGLVTLEDILEEIVGEIADEHDLVPITPVRLEDSGGVVVDGAFKVRDLNRDLDWALPEDDAATVAGLLIHEAKRIPDLQESFVFHGYIFEVLRRRSGQITSLRVTPIEEK